MISIYDAQKLVDTVTTLVTLFIGVIYSKFIGAGLPNKERI